MTTHVHAVTNTIAAVGTCIRDLTELNGGVPSGELYAFLMAAGVTLNNYNAILRALEGANLIEVKSNYVKWVGPAKGTR